MAQTSSVKTKRSIERKKKSTRLESRKGMRRRKKCPYADLNEKTRDAEISVRERAQDSFQNPHCCTTRTQKDTIREHVFLCDSCKIFVLSSSVRFVRPLSMKRDFRIEFGPILPRNRKQSSRSKEEVFATALLFDSISERPRFDDYRSRF